MVRFSLLLAFAVHLALWVNAAGGESLAAHRYTVHVDAGLQRFDIRACFAGPAPRAVTSRKRGTARYLRLPDRGEALELRGERLYIRRTGKGNCIEYAVALPPYPSGGRWGPFLRTGKSVVLSHHLLLWLPPGHTLPTPIEVDFQLPAGMTVSAPGTVLSQVPGRTVFRLGPRPLDWDGRVAIGRFDTVRLDFPGGSAQIAILDGKPPARKAETLEWVRKGADALVMAHGRFPVPAAQVLVIPGGRGGEPVPWGQVMRGGGDAVHLYIDQTRPLTEFFADWTLVHELSHLLHPRIASDGAWLSEGLASYYQNVLRARAGLLDPADAWDRLHAGFQRGIRGTPVDRTLAEVTENMMRDRSFMRVYWSGAAIALLADTGLRYRSDGTQSLDSVLGKLARCCLPTTRLWGTRELMMQLDTLSDTDVFTTLYARYAHSNHFPDLGEAYRLLGIEAHGRRLHFDNRAPLAATRRAIMAPPSGDAP
ncbi:MAG: hypothetical protein JSW10_06560 [Pseudomonadota bacterium]|nr:MAG: hypothetical protein JSW10_06560 [Pseudomonadota bacterium]